MMLYSPLMQATAQCMRLTVLFPGMYRVAFVLFPIVNLPLLIYVRSPVLF